MSSLQLEHPAQPVVNDEKILVVFDSGKNGALALDEARSLANQASVFVITLAPQAPLEGCARCRSAVGPYNKAVKEEAHEELKQAKKILDQSPNTSFTVLSGCPQPPLSAWVSEHDFTLILLPYHRLTRHGSPHLKQLKRTTSAKIRLVGKP